MAYRSPHLSIRKRQESNLRPREGQPLSRRCGTPTAFASVPALSDESFPAEPERRGVEVASPEVAPGRAAYETAALLVVRGSRMGTAGVEPAPRSRRDHGLPLTYAPVSGTLLRAPGEALRRAGRGGLVRRSPKRCLPM